ncbi:hypothetical protein HanXRQr2_Chr14g0634391 [Helianthus annuus]|uniref:Uncharacterized protein n=1 Tax=Helianthus annuus TaxID=4232 RepID=A0A9K3H7Q1_HELAN|nr:hypothetical protein HanXRQr2_Chr14g0634391 [Helianthus annuus]
MCFSNPPFGSSYENSIVVEDPVAPGTALYKNSTVRLIRKKYSKGMIDTS